MVAVRLGIQVQHISIVPGEYRTQFRGLQIVSLAETPGSEAHHRMKLERYVMKTLAGGEVTYRKFGRRDGTDNDNYNAMEMVRQGLECRSDATAEACLEYLRACVNDVLDEPRVWSAVTDLAGRLIEIAEGYFDGGCILKGEFQAIMEPHRDWWWL